MVPNLMNCAHNRGTFADKKMLVGIGISHNFHTKIFALSLTILSQNGLQLAVKVQQLTFWLYVLILVTFTIAAK